MNGFSRNAWHAMPEVRPREGADPDRAYSRVRHG